MPTTIITEEQWLKLKPILLDLNVYDKPSLKQTFLGIIYRLKTGCQWRYLPSCYGKANTVFKAFRRWSASGLFYRLFKRLIKNADTEWVSIDATYVRAHQCWMTLKLETFLSCMPKCYMSIDIKI